MKLTQAELTEFLKGIGVHAELVETEEESEFSKDDLLTSVDDNRKQILKPLIEGELRESIETTIAGKVGGTLDRVLKRTTGINVKELEGLGDEEKINKALTYKNSLLEGDKIDTQTEVNKILEAHKAEVDAIKNEYDGKLSEAHKKYIDRDIKEFVATQLKDAPIPKNADRSVIAQDFVRHLQDKYHLSYDEATKAAELFSKDKPEMPAMNSAKNAKISILDEAKEFLTPRGLWESDMSGRNAAEEMKNLGNQGYEKGAKKVIPLNATVADKKANFMKNLTETLQADQT